MICNVVRGKHIGGIRARKKSKFQIPYTVAMNFEKANKPVYWILTGSQCNYSNDDQSTFTTDLQLREHMANVLESRDIYKFAKIE